MSTQGQILVVGSMGAQVLLSVSKQDGDERATGSSTGDVKMDVLSWMLYLASWVWDFTGSKERSVPACRCHCCPVPLAVTCPPGRSG